jgi:hypothetical protein
LRPSPRQHSANHPPVPMVNRDASRSFAGRDNGGPAPHARAGRDGLTGNAGRRHVVRRVEPDGRNHRRSRCGHDRNGCRSPPGRGSVCRGTAVLGWGRPDQIARPADDRRGNSCDTAPACVPRHGVVHGVEAKPGSWARRRACRQWCGAGGVSTSHLNPTPSSVPDQGMPLTADAQRLATKPSSAIPPGVTLRLRANDGTAPDLRGFRQPSTAMKPPCASGLVTVLPT